MLIKEVIPALLLKYHNARKNGNKSVTLWGIGAALREFIFADDIASAGVLLLDNYSGSEPINVGTGEEVSIMELSEMIKNITGFEGDIITDPTKPDGMMRRLCDSSVISSMGWKPKTKMEDGIRNLYHWFLAQSQNCFDS